MADISIAFANPRLVWSFLALLAAASTVAILVASSSSGTYHRASVSNLKGTAPTGGIAAPASLLLAYYGQYEKGKFYAATEYRRNPVIESIPTAFFTVPFSLDERAWYVMTSYRVATKLQLGTYYSHYEDKSKKGKSNLLAANLGFTF